jgi:SAM-dependent methyltransferase
MDLFESTLKIKDFVYKGNHSLIKVRDEIEMSSSNISILFSHGEIETLDDYYNKTTFAGLTKGLYDLPEEFIVARRHLNFQKFDMQRLLKNTPDEVNTKEYWNFLHYEFQYCDVMTYPIFPNLANYFGTKGPLYDVKIDHLPGKLQFFRKKKILEIGGGYGYLPRLLAANKIKHKYYHADIVKRFDCDNFIDLDGYNLTNSISEKFDVILMFDVFQHLNITTIYAYFKQMKSLLNDGGHILIATPFLNKEHRSIGTFFAQSYLTPSENEFIKILDDNLYSYQKIDYYCLTHLEGCFYIIKNKVQ